MKLPFHCPRRADHPDGKDREWMVDVTVPQVGDTITFQGTEQPVPQVWLGRRIVAPVAAVCPECGQMGVASEVPAVDVPTVDDSVYVTEMAP